MRGSLRGQLPSGVGFALALIAFAWLLLALVMAVLVPGHWGDVLRIASVCAGVWGASAVLVQRGRSRSHDSAGRSSPISTGHRSSPQPRSPFWRRTPMIRRKNQEGIPETIAWASGRYADLHVVVRDLPVCAIRRRARRGFAFPDFGSEFRSKLDE